MNNLIPLIGEYSSIIDVAMLNQTRAVFLHLSASEVINKFNQAGAWSSYKSPLPSMAVSFIIAFLLLGAAYIIFSAYRDWRESENFTFGDFVFLVVRVSFALMLIPTVLLGT